MLVAECDGKRVCAASAERGLEYVCPACKEKVTLRKGAVRVAHFAHQKDSDCDCGGNQSEEHMRTKQAIYEFFLGLQCSPKLDGEVVEMEYPIANKDRVADVYVRIWHAQLPFVVEIQKTPISREEIVSRTQSYLDNNIAVLWIVPATLEDLRKKSANGLLSMYSPSDYERWIHGFNRGRIYYYDYERNLVLEARFLPAKRYIEGNAFGGGYEKTYKRYKDLRIVAEYPLEEATFLFHDMKSFETSNFFWPEGWRILIRQERQEYKDDRFQFQMDREVIDMLIREAKERNKEATK